MSENAVKVSPNQNVRIRGIALPNEHGSWGFLFEPIVAAIAIAPSIAGFWTILLVVGAFLSRQPLRILISDLKAKRNLPQTTVALKFVFLYGTIFFIGIIGGLIFSRIEYFIPFALVIPFAIYQIYCDVLRKSRQLMPELTGAIAISSAAPVIALAGGWTFAAAIALWAIFAARFLPSILYVRSRLRLEKGKDVSMIPAIVFHFIALGVIGILLKYGLTSILTLAIFVILLGRASLGLSPNRRKLKAMQIGILEVVYGVLTVLSIILGYYLQI